MLTRKIVWKSVDVTCYLHPSTLPKLESGERSRTSSGGAVGNDIPPVDALSDVSFDDDSLADSDYVPNSVDESEDDIAQFAKLKRTLNFL